MIDLMRAVDRKVGAFSLKVYSHPAGGFVYVDIRWMFKNLPYNIDVPIDNLEMILKIIANTGECEL